MSEVEVLVFGSTIIDFICYVPRMPKIGETIHGTKFATGYGGKGANQCVAAAKLGAKSAMIAMVGDDSWGKNYIQNLKDEDVNTDCVGVVQGESTGIAQISVADNGDNQIVIVTGANQSLSVNHFTKALEVFKNAKVLICQLETPIQATIQALKLFKGISILNAAPALENAPIELLQNCNILCVNEVEATLITGIDIKNLNDAKVAIESLIKLGAKTVIVTLGKDGAMYSEENERKFVHVKAKHVERVVDTTGAGDAFIGAFAYFLSNNPKQSLHQIVGAACDIASISVQTPGTQISFPYGKDVDLSFGGKIFEYSYL